MTQLKPHISVIIPVYKAEHCLDELYARLKSSLESISSNFEILLIEDCGGDNSWKVIERLVAADVRVRGIQFSTMVLRREWTTARVIGWW